MRRCRQELERELERHLNRVLSKAKPKRPKMQPGLKGAICLLAVLILSAPLWIAWPAQVAPKADQAYYENKKITIECPEEVTACIKLEPRRCGCALMPKQRSNQHDADQI